MEQLSVQQSASALAEALPKQIRTSYLPLSCLQSMGQEETWVCRDRITGERVIIKLMPTGEDGGLLQNEYQLLHVVQSAAPEGLRARFPKAIACGEWKAFVTWSEATSLVCP